MVPLRWLPVFLVFVLGCTNERKTPTTNADADADTDTDTDTDTTNVTDTGTASDDSILINFDATDCDADATVVAPGPGESNMLAAAVLGPGTWPYEVTMVNVALANEPTGAATCDASQAHEVLIWVVSSSEGEPPSNTVPDYVLSAESTEPIEDPARILSLPVDPPLVLERNEVIVVALRFSGNYPDTSCIAACGADFIEGADFWSNGVDAPYYWQPLSDFNISSNLWIWAEGGVLQ
jgi:hypothetical protein